MNEELLRTVIARILAAPELQALLTAGTPGGAARPGCLIVLNDEDSVRQLPAIAAQYGQDYSLAVCVAGPVEPGDNNIPQVTCEQARQQTHWACLQVPVCTPGQVAQMAHGLSHDPTTRLVAWAITAGLPVTIGQVRWEFTGKTPAAYRQLFAGYVRQLAEFGVLIAGEAPVCPEPADPAGKPAAFTGSQGGPGLAVCPSHLTAPASRIPSAVTYEQRLLTNKEALRLPGNGVVQLGRKTVLTPGAIDILKQQKIAVYREGVRCL